MSQTLKMKRLQDSKFFPPYLPFAPYQTGHKSFKLKFVYQHNGLVAELAPHHVQSAWGSKGKGFELQG